MDFFPRLVIDNSDGFEEAVVQTNAEIIGLLRKTIMQTLGKLAPVAPVAHGARADPESLAHFGRPAECGYRVGNIGHNVHCIISSQCVKFVKGSSCEVTIREAIRKIHGMKDRELVNEESPIEVGRRLALIRRSLGRSASEICRLTGIELNTYSQWENGKRLPDIQYMKRYCRTLGIPLGYIYMNDMRGLGADMMEKMARVG